MTLRKGMGYRRSLMDIRDFKFAPAVQQPLPNRRDLRPNCAPVYDQKNLGSCTSFSVIGAYIFAEKKQGKPGGVYSHLGLYFMERAIEKTIASDAGAMIRTGLKVVLADGLIPESEWPYDESQFAVRPPQQDYHDALAHKALRYESITQNLYNFRYCIASGYPFTYGISVYGNFPMDTPTGDIPMPNNEATNEGHAMLAVGYDDDRRVFIVQNSWGTGWGAGGFGTIPYDYLLNPDLADDFWRIMLVA